MTRRVRLVDVFGERPLAGNPLAVVIDAEGLATAEMQEMTRWLNLSETTFLLPPESPEANYRVRIFTLAGELPFAGHPTLGTCHVWNSLDDGLDEVVQECGAGLVRLRCSDEVWEFEAPPQTRDGPVEPDRLEDFAHVLGIPVSEIVASRWVDNGPGWVGILLRSAEDVEALEPDFARSRHDGPLDIGVAGFHRDDMDARYEVRAFFSDHREEMIEDPVTGSLNASMAQWLVSEGRVQTPYVATQGSRLGRSGRIHISTDHDGSVWVGGRVFDVQNGVWVV